MNARRTILALSFVLAPTEARAQFNDAWIGFAKDASRLQAGVISDADHETDLAWGDLDQNGFVDLVVVRKQPFTSPGKRSNVLLMNSAGVLTDTTSTDAAASDIGGDQGFLTPTNDRDVVIADVDQDGWLDVCTATTISDGDPKHIGHPRIYRNLAGSWSGLRHEDARFPQLLHYGTGFPENPRFCSVSAGDVTGDGYPDLFFGDYDSSGAGGAQQPANKDLNDRLLVNDGSGFFSDQSLTRMTGPMLDSAFSMSNVMADLNQDGRLDVIKDTALNPPQHVAVAYNDLIGNGVGTFDHYQVVHDFEPYHLSVGDLNDDGRPDLVVTDDGDDRYRFHTGLDGLGRATFGPAKTFDHVSDGDEGFGGNNLIADLDGDGFDDVIITDKDVDIANMGSRTHIYHNRGQPGQQGNLDLVLREERQDQSNVGWVGAPGITGPDLVDTHDAAVFDLENDGDLDLILSRIGGTDVYVQGPVTPSLCQPNLGYQNGNTYLSVCGGDLSTGNPATLELQNIPFFAQVYLFVGTGTNPTYVPELSSTLVTFPLAAMIPITSFGVFDLHVPVPAGFSGLSVTVQAATILTFNPLVYDVSNAVRIDWP